MTQTLKQYIDHERAKASSGAGALDECKVYFIFMDKEPVSWVRVPGDIDDQSSVKLINEFLSRHMLFYTRGYTLRPKLLCSNSSHKKLEDVEEFVISERLYNTIEANFKKVSFPLEETNSRTIRWTDLQNPNSFSPKEKRG